MNDLRENRAEESARPLATERDPVWFWIGLGLAAALHLVLLPRPGFTGDLKSFDSWMRAALDYGVAHIGEHTWCDYFPGYLYLLEGVGRLWIAVAGQPLPPFGSAANLILLKAVPALADLVGAWVLYRIACAHVRPARAAAIALSYAFNPALVFNSALWGQADSLLALFALLALWAISRARIAVGFAVAAIAISIKPQAVVLVPLLGFGAFHVAGARAFIAASVGAVLAWTIVLLPFLTAGRVGWVVQVARIVVGEYSVVSVHAHNVWWLIFGRESPNTIDLMRFGNALLSYRALGTIMLAVATLFVLWRLWADLRARPNEPMAALCEAGALQVFAFYLFPTEMHERYIVPALICFAATMIWKPRWAWAYLLASATTLVSLATVLTKFGPMFRDSHVIPYAASVVFTALFTILLLATPNRRFRELVPIVTLLCVSATLGVAALPVKWSQRLCDWRPIGWKQEWGALQIDRSVAGHPLTVSGRTFAHGFGTHSASTISYHLNGAFQNFDAALGIDDEANRGQKIEFRVVADESVVYDSGELSGPDTLRYVWLPVTGVQYLSLQVLDGGDGINSDHADWLEPVLHR